MRLIIKIQKRFLRGLIDLGIHSKTRQITTYPSNQTFPKARILIIGPGEISIPTSGWGAVETVIEETSKLYLDKGYLVTLLNSNNRLDWIKVGRNFDLILNHNDRATRKVRKFWKQPPLITFSHYGFGQYEDLWNGDYKKILQKMNDSDFIICLNDRIKEVYSNHIDTEKLIVSPNGSEFMPVKNLPSNGKFVCVGKIESRKRQYETWKDSVREKIGIDFIGPISDDRVESLISQKKSSYSCFLGAMTRKDLSEVLSKYRALILPSLGEADALVLYEAQLAGLPVFVTKSGYGAQDLGLSWIKLIPTNFEFSALVEALDSIDCTSSQIAQFAETNYRWSLRHEPVLYLMERLIND